MYRVLKIPFILCLYFLVFANYSLASENFDTYISSEYYLKNEGDVHSINTISIQNLKSESYVPEFKYYFKDIVPKNISFTEGKTSTNLTASDDNSITMSFKSPVLGLGKTKTFVLSYDIPAMTKNGEVQEVKIPGIREDSKPFDKVEISVHADINIGSMLFMTPRPYKTESKANEAVYYFKGDLERGISGAFGKNQVYSFKLIYHLKNDKPYKKTMEIALPPDTSTQRIFLTDFSKIPESVMPDLDGNWIAKYILKGSERIDVTVNGFAEVFASPIERFNYSDPKHYLSLFGHWSDSPEISRISSTLKNPFDIYKFVSENLTYDYKRVGPETKRLGADSALKNPASSVCTEYTDTFIALSRKIGIPAREINGYGVTDNPKIQPLSLVADILHSWPEYWNSDTKTWTPIDPTWASTTKGGDYFSTFDLKHIAFVIHGTSDELPLPPGSYKLEGNSQKDVYVNTSSLPTNLTEKSSMSFYKKTNIFGYNTYFLKLKNIGSSAIYMPKLTIKIDNLVVDDRQVHVVLPYGIYEVEVKVPTDISSGILTSSFLGLEESSDYVRFSNQIILRNSIAFIFLVLVCFLFYKKRVRRNIYDEIH